MTRDVVHKSEPIRPTICESVVEGMVTNPMTHIGVIGLKARDVEQNLLRPPEHGRREEKRVVDCVELDGISLTWGLGLRLGRRRGWPRLCQVGRLGGDPLGGVWGLHG